MDKYISKCIYLDKYKDKYLQKVHWNWHITFLLDLECVRRPYVIASDTTKVIGKNPIWTKMTKNGKK